MEESVEYLKQEFNLEIKKISPVRNTRLNWFVELNDEELKNQIIDAVYHKTDNRIGKLIVLKGKFNTNVDYNGFLTNKHLEDYMKKCGYKCIWSFNWGEELYFIKWI